MSLFYGALDSESRRRIRGEITLPKFVSFDSVAAIATPPWTASREDVERWREIERHEIYGRR